MSYDDDAEFREAFEECVRAESVNRAEAVVDQAFMVGDQWPIEQRNARQIDKRPCLTFNRLPAATQQITNDQRQNKQSIKIHPVGSGADVDTARVYQGLVRHIEYESSASAAYITAVFNASVIGWGYFGLTTKYVDEKSFDQKIAFRRFRDPLKVYLDPLAQEQDASDMRCAFVTDEVAMAQFEKEYPKASTSAGPWLTERGIGDRQVTWMTDNTVTVFEAWQVKETKATLLMLADGTTVFEDDLPSGFPMETVAATRPSNKRKVLWTKRTGNEILEETEIPCRWIPIFPVWGTEQVVNGRIDRSGIVRYAKDPQMAYNFLMTSATEEVGLRTKTPFIMAEGQDEGYENKWAQANVRSYASLKYKPVTIEGKLAPPPMRQQMADVPAGNLMLARHAAEDLQATTGIYPASTGASSNETSGIAIRQRERQGDTTNYHYTDNLAYAILHCGRCLVNMIPRVYDTQRVVAILGDDEKIDKAEINKPKLDEFGNVEKVLNDLTVGRYDVTVSSGPSYSTLRQEASEAMVQMAGAWPKMMDVAGDKVVGSMDWPGADQIAARLEKTIPPELREGEDGGDGEEKPQMPPEALQAMQAAAQQIEQLHQVVEDLGRQLESKEADRQANLQEARIKAGAEVEKAKIDANAEIMVAKIDQQTERMQELMESVDVIAQVVDKLVNPQGQGDTYE